MARIPVGDGSFVADHLVWGDDELLARAEEPPATMPARLRITREWIAKTVRAVAPLKRGIPLRDLAYFGARVAAFLATCRERRVTELDEVTWWDYVGAGEMSAAYQHLVAELPATGLIAVRAETASTRTLGDAMIQMLGVGFSPRTSIDRLLDGPEQLLWVQPWVDHVRALGGDLRIPAALVELECDGRRITGAIVEENGARRRVVTDHYVCALPVEAASRCLGATIRRAAPSLARLDELRLGWMTGLQLFLRRPIPLVRGHVAYDDSPWALTSVSQAQFWPRFDWSAHGDGTAREVFSVIISDWDTPGRLVKKPAKECSAEEVILETVAQLNASLARVGERIDAQDIAKWFIDPDVAFPRAAPGVARNQEPLFITTVGAWSARPEPVTEIPNLFLASDWLRTTMDFASAEGANEVARRAVNGLLDACGSTAPRCKLFPPRQPRLFAPLRLLDGLLYRLGLPGLGYWGFTRLTPPARER
jgi:uncharacterized protein with NAD-binding domain and iron-sulfur cluster